MKRKRKNNPFLTENMFYNKELDFYVCPMGQRLEFVGTKKESSDLGYTSTKSLYQAKDCSNCPLRGMCYKGKCRTRSYRGKRLVNAEFATIAVAHNIRK